MPNDIGTKPLVGSSPVVLNNRDVAPNSAATTAPTQQPIPTGGAFKPQVVSGSNGKAKQNALMAKLPKKEQINNQSANNNNNNNNNNNINNNVDNNNVTTASSDLIAAIGANFRHMLEIEAKAAGQVAEMADAQAARAAKSAEKWNNM